MSEARNRAKSWPEMEEEGGTEGEALAESEELERKREQRGRGGGWSSEVQAWVLPYPLRWVQGQDVSVWLGAEAWVPSTQSSLSKMRSHTLDPAWAAQAASRLYCRPGFYSSSLHGTALPLAPLSCHIPVGWCKVCWCLQVAPRRQAQADLVDKMWPCLSLSIFGNRPFENRGNPNLA